jgi:hypothetical protein
MTMSPMPVNPAEKQSNDARIAVAGKPDGN